MSDLISLTCPNCGGDLKITAGTTSYTCQHCGKQHIIKAEAGTYRSNRMHAVQNAGETTR